MNKVMFATSDSRLQHMYDEAERLLKDNIVRVDNIELLIDGAGYNAMWIEDGPMYADLIARRRPDISRNIIETIMRHQRTDGRPGGMYKIMSAKDADNQTESVTDDISGLIVYYGYLQGFCFPEHALNLYYYEDLGIDYLERLYRMLEKYDDYLWKTRDSDGDGCLEIWCEWDTGEDDALRLKGLLHGWGADYPPLNTAAPIESMDVMSFSYTARNVLSKTSALLGNGKQKEWENKAKAVADKIREYLWVESRGACFDRDKNNEIVPALIHNNLRCMYYGSFSQEMADIFVRRHLKNPEEFWTKVPLPSVAANDPLFENSSDMNYRGQPHGITFVRALFALERYGFFSEVTEIGRRLIGAIGEDCRFTPQFDPFTGKPTQSSFGGAFTATMLAFLEHICRMYGVEAGTDSIRWYAVNTPENSSYIQIWKEHEYRIDIHDGIAYASVDGTGRFSFHPGFRIVTDFEGRLLEADCIETEDTELVINDKSYGCITPDTRVML